MIVGGIVKLPDGRFINRAFRDEPDTGPMIHLECSLVLQDVHRVAIYSCLFNNVSVYNKLPPLNTSDRAVRARIVTIPFQALIEYYRLYRLSEIL